MDRNCQENQQDQKGYHNDDQEDKIHQICHQLRLSQISQISKSKSQILRDITFPKLQRQFASAMKMHLSFF